MSVSKKSRMSVLGMGSVRDSKREKGREVGVEKKGNVSKVGLEVEVMPSAKGVLEVSERWPLFASLSCISRCLTFARSYKSEAQLTIVDRPGSALHISRGRRC